MFKKITKYIIYLLVFLTPIFFLPFTVEWFDFNKGYLIIALVGLGFFSWLANMIFEKKEVSFKFSKLDLAALGFILLTALTIVFSKDKTISLFGAYGRFWPSFSGLLALGIFYFLLRNNVAPSHQPAKEVVEKKAVFKPATIGKVLDVLLVSGFVLALTSGLAIFGFFSFLAKQLPQVKLFNFLQGAGFNLAGNSLENLAIFLAFITIVAICRMAFAKKNVLAKVFLGLLLLSNLVVLALVDYWPSFLALSLGLLLFLGFAFWKRVFKEDVNRLALPIFLLAISLIFLFANPLGAIFGQSKFITNLPKEVLLKQSASWQLSWQALKGEPVFGSGLANFGYAFAKFKPVSFLAGPFWQVRMNRAANFLSETLANVGLVGILSYLALLAIFSLAIYRATFNKTKKQGVVLLAGFLVLFVGQVLYYQTTILAFAFWLMLALVAVLVDEQKQSKVIAFNKVPEIGLALSVCFWILLVGFAFVGFTMNKLYLADIAYNNYLKNPTGDLSQLEKAVRIGDNRANYHIVLANAYLTKFQSDIASQNQDVTQLSQTIAMAVDQARRAIVLSPNNVASQEMAALIYRDIQGLTDGAFDWAVKSFEEALILEPNNPALLVELGKLYLNQTEPDYQKASNYFEKAVALKGDYLEARFQLGRLYYNQKEFDKAQEQFITALQIFPDHSNSLYSLALIYNNKGQKNEALLLMKRVAELNPDNQAVKDKISEMEGGNKLPVEEPVESNQE